MKKKKKKKKKTACIQQWLQKQQALVLPGHFIAKSSRVPLNYPATPLNVERIAMYHIYLVIRWSYFFPSKQSQKSRFF